MKSRLPWLLAAASLAFNVLFILGFVQARSDVAKSETFSGRMELMARKLDLDQQQRQAFDQFLHKMQLLRKDRTPQTDALFAEIIKGKPDKKVIEEFVLGKATGEHRLAKFELWQEFIAALRPEQRERFVELIKKRRSASK